MTMDEGWTSDTCVLHIPLKWEIAAVVLVFGLAIFLRVNHLAADPPVGITFSQDIETDPPQYTTFARNDILTGSWNPYQDFRYITYEYSLVSFTSWVVYHLFGIGVYQANLTAVILSLLSLLLFYWVLRKILGNGVALLALFFAGINYLGIFYGRRPFLENGMNLLLLTGLFCLTCWEDKKIGHFLFGLFLGSAIVFGKVIALAFLGIPAAYYLFRLIYLKERNALMQSGLMVAGFLSVAVFWLVAIFLPNAASVTGYLSEQAIGLYGAPEGFRSPFGFVWKFLTFGVESEFFSRMPAISIGAAAMVIVLSGRIFRRPDRKDQPRYGNTLLVAIAVWLVVTYLAQMPWNYQPARYQTTMIFPMAALTAALIAHLWNLRSSFNLLNSSVRFNLILFVVTLLVAYRLAGAVVESIGSGFYFSDFSFVVVPTVLLFSIAYYFFSARQGAFQILWPAASRYIIIGGIITLSIMYQGKNYWHWAKTPVYTTTRASIDLGMVLSPGAVVAGPFGPALTLENNLGCVIHIFGTSRPDTLLFQRYPITHLALERSNEQAARDIYPEIMKKAHKVCQYYLDCRKITVYRIAYYTKNEQAGQYLLSNYEKAIRYYELQHFDSADFYLQRFLKINPDNISGNAQAGCIALLHSNVDDAIAYFSRAVEFSPTDFYLHYLLGKAYIDKAKLASDDSLWVIGNREIGLATLYNLGFMSFDENDTMEPAKDSLNDSTGIVD